MARSNPLYADPATAPNRQTVIMLTQKHASYRGYHLAGPTIIIIGRSNQYMAIKLDFLFLGMII